MKLVGGYQVLESANRLSEPIIDQNFRFCLFQCNTSYCKEIMIYKGQYVCHWILNDKTFLVNSSLGDLCNLIVVGKLIYV